MVGFVWVDTLRLTLAQWALLYGVFLLGLWTACHPLSEWRDCLLSVAFLLALRLAYHSTQIGIDVATTWAQLPRLANLPGRALLSELAFLNYLKLQPPLWTWILTRTPSYGFHQSFSVVVGALIFALIYRGEGRTTAWLCLATPLFQLMTVQPSNDWWSCGLLCLAWAAGRRQPVWCSVWFCAACTLKYTSYALLPCLLFLSWQSATLAVAGIAGYWLCAASTGMRWWTLQADYVLKLFTMGTVSLSRPVSIAKIGQTVTNHARGRLRLMGWWSKACFAWYLCPLWMRANWAIIGVALCILVGFSNCKYGVLLFPLLIPRRN